jgi:UBX domain-containing protein 1
MMISSPNSWESRQWALKKYVGQLLVRVSSDGRSFHIANSRFKAEQYLEAAQWDFQSALTAFYNPPEETADDQEQEEEMTNVDGPSSTPLPQSGSGRRLGDESESTDTQAIPSTSSSRSAKPPKRATADKKFATLVDIGNESHGHDDPDDSDYDDDKNLFAGGEKSALAVQNPDDLKKKILEKARQ